jgi:uncharacterized protein
MSHPVSATTRRAAFVLVVTAATIGITLATIAPAGAATRSRTITVTGVGQVRGTPDVADLSIGVTGRGASAAEALGAVSDRANALLAVLRDAGVGDDDIQTRDLSVQPTYDGRDRITGFEASNTVVARVRDIGRAGAVVDAAAAKVGDAVRMNGITFSIDDDSALLATARTKAAKRARAQAEQLAAGAGVELGDVLTIRETSAGTPVNYPLAADAAGGASTPVEPGTQTLSVSATVVFAID